MMNPNPLDSLKNLTLPVFIMALVVGKLGGKATVYYELSSSLAIIILFSMPLSKAILSTNSYIVKLLSQEVIQFLGGDS
jgi:hypothetical protein